MNTHHPVSEKRSALYALPWPEFVERLPEFLAFKKSIKVRPTPLGYLCSYYRNANDFDVWLADSDPTKGGLLR